MSNTDGKLYRPWLQAEVTGTTANFPALTLPPCQLAGVTAVAGLLALLNFRFLLLLCLQPEGVKSG